MFADIYPSIFSRQMEAIVYSFSQKRKKIHSGGATEFQGKMIKYSQCPPSSLSADIVIIEKLLTLRRFSPPFEALHFKVLVMKYRVSRTFFPCSCFLLFFLSISSEPYTSPTNFYKELPNSDFPSLHDYGCSNSRLFDACQLAVYDVTEAKYKCDWDDRCKAFVTTARTLWTGEWTQSPRWTSNAPWQALLCFLVHYMVGSFNSCDLELSSPSLQAI